MLAVVCHKDSLVAEQRAITNQGTNHAGSNPCDECNPIHRVSCRERSVLHVFRLKREPYATQGSPDLIAAVRPTKFFKKKGNWQQRENTEGGPRWVASSSIAADVAVSLRTQFCRRMKCNLSRDEFLSSCTTQWDSCLDSCWVVDVRSVLAISCECRRCHRDRDDRFES